MRNKLEFYYLMEPKSCPRQRVTKSSHSFSRPQRLQHREIPSKGLIHASKPDLDNCLKAVMDGLCDAQIYRDDNLVYEIVSIKEYCNRMDDGSFEYSHIKISVFWK